MVDRIPDEIVSQVLSPLLKFSDRVFSDTSEKPLLTPGYSSSTYLLVCKAWLRVSTPLLYNVVILRTTAQAEALHKVLRTNEEFGLFIKKLRVEGGFGRAMHTILKCAPNISDLFLTLSIWGSDNVAGLCRGLRLINPQHVILVDVAHDYNSFLEARPRKNKQVTQLLDTLVELIPKWDKLTIFDFPYVGDVLFSPFSGHAETIAAALTQSKSLHTVLVTAGTEFPEYLHRLADLPTLKLICFRMRWQFDDFPSFDRLFKELQKAVDAHPKCEMVEDDDRFDENHSGDDMESGQSMRPNIIPSSNSTYTPMKSVPEDIQEAVWKRILAFAMIAAEYNSSSSLISFMLVSKTFHKLALPFLYRDPCLDLPTALLFVQRIKANPGLGAHVRSLLIPHNPQMIPDETMQTIVKHCPRLQKFGDSFRENDDPAEPYFADLPAESYFVEKALRVGGLISLQILKLLGQTVGPTLRELGVTLSSRRLDPAFLVHFSALENLIWNSSSEFISSNSRLVGLELLRALRVERGSMSFLDVLSEFPLPNFHHLSLSTDVNGGAAVEFLRRHGAKLTELRAPFEVFTKLNVLGICTRLVTVVAMCPFEYETSKDPRIIIAEDLLASPHSSLVKIRFQLDTLERQHDATFKIIFAAIDPARFPELQEIQITCAKWPTSEHGIPKSKWVRLAELLRPKNIKLTNGEGVSWIPRSRK
ncbi:hypothetical protein C8R44DRAFT_687918 [Mycena epipterygia]|nr:hypothetical protein C8R44DRAFT_687918 [Mycena epipterygia]